VESEWVIKCGTVTRVKVKRRMTSVWCELIARPPEIYFVTKSSRHKCHVLDLAVTNLLESECSRVCTYVHLV